MTEFQTKQVSWDCSPAMPEGAIRDKLLELGWATPELYAKQLKYSEKLCAVIDEYDSLLNELLEEILPSIALSVEMNARLDEGIHIPVSPEEEAANDKATKGETE